MKKTLICFIAISVMSLSTGMTFAQEMQRQAEVAKRGKDIMPFSLKATTHIFTKTPDGGLQRVVAKDATDAGQIQFVRTHLQEIKQQFLKGDFSGPSHIHGADMPGLGGLRTAKAGQLSILYRDVDGGAELEYRTKQPKLITALHLWFNAQLSDHGTDAMPGHQHHHGSMPNHP